MVYYGYLSNWLFSLGAATTSVRFSNKTILPNARVVYETCSLESSLCINDPVGSRFGARSRTNVHGHIGLAPLRVCGGR